MLSCGHSTKERWADGLDPQTKLHEPKLVPATWQSQWRSQSSLDARNIWAYSSRCLWKPMDSIDSRAGCLYECLDHACYRDFWKVVLFVRSGLHNRNLCGFVWRYQELESKVICISDLSKTSSLGRVNMEQLGKRTHHILFGFLASLAVAISQNHTIHCHTPQHPFLHHVSHVLTKPTRFLFWPSLLDFRRAIAPTTPCIGVAPFFC